MKQLQESTQTAELREPSYATTTEHINTTQHFWNLQKKGSPRTHAHHRLPNNLEPMEIERECHAERCLQGGSDTKTSSSIYLWRKVFDWQNQMDLAAATIPNMVNYVKERNCIGPDKCRAKFSLRPHNQLEDHWCTTRSMRESGKRRPWETRIEGDDHGERLWQHREAKAAALQTQYLVFMKMRSHNRMMKP